jgi:hypothetical protein
VDPTISNRDKQRINVTPVTDIPVLLRLASSIIDLHYECVPGLRVGWNCPIPRGALVCSNSETETYVVKFSSLQYT